MTSHENSVRMNLEDLFAMEADRRAEAAVAAERARAEAEARRETERREREEAIAAAGAEERRRAEQAQRSRDAALEDRLRALRDQLAEVQAERETMHRKVAALATQPAPTPRRSVWRAGVMAAASVAAAVTATSVAWPRADEPMANLAPAAVAVEESPVPTVEPSEPVAEPAPPIGEVAVADPAAAVEEAPSRPARTDRRTNTRREQAPPTERRTSRRDDLGRALDALNGGDQRDVLSPGL
jgi:colicin import membrane protein